MVVEREQKAEAIWALAGHGNHERQTTQMLKLKTFNQALAVSQQAMRIFYSTKHYRRQKQQGKKLLHLAPFNRLAVYRTRNALNSCV
jgi:CRISPR/Cas system CSM-associated protein Csm2 small subunit